ncbi:MAG: MobF family relaxase, partial [Acidimicrobiales bacterium]|nr:MobF family relaxase [Acidimicrobiales bacterium]
MRMMGADSVEYHAATVLGREDDHPGRALAYYAERGETPLTWGGAAAADLGLDGAVSMEEYVAVFGPGGLRDPSTNARLVRASRPGMELVVAAHKSVAELGVIGRAEDMHRILDAERDATVAYLERVTVERGGRRGREATPTQTSGLVFATTRHATSRAGDPSPHDHVLLANAVRMGDERGGWKAADTTLWREHLHAATMVGRVASARVAAELGYGIVADDGPSGRLGHWAIAGIPAEVMGEHSKRAAQISAAVGERSEDTYRARQVAARATRDAKTSERGDDLIARWQAEVAAVGWKPSRLAAAVDAAAADYVAPGRLSKADIDGLIAETLHVDGALARRKVFTRADVIVAVAPKLFGRDPAELGRVTDRLLAGQEILPLLPRSTRSERGYVMATTIATERTIAEIAERQMARNDAAHVDTEAARAALDAAEVRLGHSLTAGQTAAAVAVTTSGRGMEVVVGVAGAGKTTALGVVREAFEAGGFRVVGTATSGQAARVLGRDADIGESRTLAGLLNRLDRGQLRLDQRCVVILDEAGMTEDVGLARLLAATEAAGAKTIIVGDDHQLPSVGAGGGLGALIDRSPAVHRLEENLRQRDPNERAALAELRHGNPEVAAAWYAERDRITTAPTRVEAIDAVVDAWAVDNRSGLDTDMYAWRRANVAALNARARLAMAAAGKLRGPKLVTDTGVTYQAGDRVVTLAPAGRGRVVTSERGTVVAARPKRGELDVRMDDQRIETLTAEELGADRL